LSTEQIIKIAFQLGQAISESGEVEELKKVQTKLQENKEASDLIARYQEAVTNMNNKAKDGILITKPEKDHLAILEQQLNTNLIVKELMDSQAKFNNLMQAVQYTINQAIFSTDCSSGCSSCGGSCNM